MKNNWNTKSSMLTLALGILTLGLGTTAYADGSTTGVNSQGYTNGKKADSAYNTNTTDRGVNTTNRNSAYRGTQNSDQMGHFRSSSREDVRQVQAALADKGLYNGPIDGIIGPKTSRAVEEFQDDNNLATTGRLDVETLDRLGQDNPDWSWRSTNQYSE